MSRGLIRHVDADCADDFAEGDGHDKEVSFSYRAPVRLRRFAADAWHDNGFTRLHDFPVILATLCAPRSISLFERPYAMSIVTWSDSSCNGSTWLSSC